MQIKLTLPKPNFTVETEHTDKAHFYRATFSNGATAKASGVTHYLDIIGGDKTARLMNWATSQALTKVKEEILKRLEGKPKKNLDITAEWVESVLSDARKRPKQVKDKAADIGTRAHAYIDAHIKGQTLPTLDDDIKIVVGNFFSWLKESNIEIISGDTKVFSKKYHYGGAIDAIGFKNGEWGLLDWKSGSFIHNSYALQVGGAYAQAFRETYGIEPKWAEIVRFDKAKPEFEHKEVKDLKTSFEAFLTAKELSELMELEYYV